MKSDDIKTPAARHHARCVAQQTLSAKERERRRMQHALEAPDYSWRDDQLKRRTFRRVTK